MTPHAPRDLFAEMRLVLGAGRGRILRQLLTESVTLSVLGGGLGILFAYWGAQAIISFVSTNQPRPLAFAIGVDARVLGFTAAISLVTGILFGMAPAFRSMRVDLTPALKEGSVGVPGSGRFGGTWSNIGNALVVSQVMLAIVVLAGAGLLLRTLANIRNVDVGFDLRNLVIFRIDPTRAGYVWSHRRIAPWCEIQGAHTAGGPWCRVGRADAMPLAASRDRHPA